MHIIEDAIKVERLALIALQFIDATRLPDEAFEEAFRQALQRR